MALTYPDAPSARRPGRCWTIRVVGHRDRTASVTCSSACVMPPRSRDIAALRRFAEAHAAAHARAAAVHHDAACWCRRQRCAAHEGVRVHCAGTVVLVVQHDPAVGQVWTLSEVCSACAPLMPHARVLSRAVPPPPTAPAEERETPYVRPAPPGPAASSASAPPRHVPGGFSAPTTTAGLGAVPSPGSGAGTGRPERSPGRRHAVGRRRGAPGRAQAEGAGE
ncbi:hypothetical protein OG562_40560 [Streptomyces sp. NBC_01275]|uniref:hypothetical protein n=1 Tax=Streptomyces sp. NBC_01275 TaxID=2903807 RepID=UPI00224E4849|nr:hypothetical protein [Streptomyces sp. NBC_01275]MCX4767157.1 hypothetical protein [Streptomyces sp. NBC_01275]